MKKLLLFLKMIVILIGFLSTMAVATFSSIYVFTGFSKDAYMQVMNKIPKETFGYIIIPTIIISFCVGVFLFKKLYNVGLSKNKTDMKNVITIAIREAQTNNLKIVKDSDNDEDKA